MADTQGGLGAVPAFDDADVSRALEALAPGIQEQGGDEAVRSFDLFVANVMRALALDAVQNANSGHPGGPCSSMDFAVVLHRHYLRASRDPEWLDRDRFVLSGGHMSTLLYGMLLLQGRMTMEDLKQFRQLGARTQGHPVNTFCPGIETTTGPLGQGFANGVGMALAERLDRETFGEGSVHHRTWVLATDGDLQEGICREAAQLAGLWELGHLNVFFDSNDIQLASPTAECWSEDVAKFFEGCGWHVQTLDGHDHGALHGAIRAALEETGRPSLLIGKTKIAKGTEKEGRVETHGAPVGDDTIAAYKEARKHPAQTFWLPEVVAGCLSGALDRGDEEQAAWRTRLDAAQGRDPALAERWELHFGEGRGATLAERASKAVRSLSFEKPVATRSAAGKALAALVDAVPCLVGGSADLANSTKTDGFEKAAGYLGHGPGKDGGAARGIHYGVREHAMASISNGMALHGGWMPFAGTFLVFSDYLRPAIRLGSISRLPVTYVFTHDSIFLGEDGETHQPVEHTESLRLIPGVRTLRPADAYEAAIAWEWVIEEHGKEDPRPLCLVLSRQNLPVLDGGFERAAGLKQGGYLLRGDAGEVPDVELVASGSEVALALEVAAALEERDRRVRVVSMPCRELFESQDAATRDAVLHPECRLRIVLEAGRVASWDGPMAPALVERVEVDRYGQSAPAKDLAEEYGFTAAALTGRVEAALDAVAERLRARIEGDLAYLRARQPKALEGEGFQALLG